VGARQEKRSVCSSTTPLCDNWQRLRWEHRSGSRPTTSDKGVNAFRSVGTLPVARIRHAEVRANILETKDISFGCVQVTRC